MIEYRIQDATADNLTILANDDGWKLVTVLHGISPYYLANGEMVFRVLLSKTEPDNLSGLMINVDKPKPKPRGRPRKDAS